MFIEKLPDTPMNKRMATGHLIRLGHQLNAVHVSQDGMLWHRVYLCCGESIPETVKTWNDITPTPNETKD